MYLLIMDEESSDPPLDGFHNFSIESEHHPITTIEALTPAISYHALAGGYSIQTLRLQGNINSMGFQVLIDSGSTDNFLQEHIAKHLGLTVIPSLISP